MSASGSEPVLDPVTGQPATIGRVQPVEAVKDYTCPGCRHEIRAGTGHYVVVPVHAPEDRRHWHIPCWDFRESRIPGR